MFKKTTVLSALTFQGGNRCCKIGTDSYYCLACGVHIYCKKAQLEKLFCLNAPDKGTFSRSRLTCRRRRLLRGSVVGGYFFY